MTACERCGVTCAVVIDGRRLHFGCDRWTGLDPDAPATLDLGILDPLLDRMEAALPEPDAQAGRMDAERDADQLAWQAVELQHWNEGAHERAARATEPEDADDEPEAAPEALAFDWQTP